MVNVCGLLLASQRLEQLHGYAVVVTVAAGRIGEDKHIVEVGYQR